MDPARESPTVDDIASLFVERFTDAVAHHELELFSFCLMPNHWHSFGHPLTNGEMSRFAQWLGLTHARRYSVHHKTVGQVPVDQGRYKLFPIQADEHFLAVWRYIERNANTAELCGSPEAWCYGSLHRGMNGTKHVKSHLAKWPVARRLGWARHVKEALSSKQTKRMEWSEKRDGPYGDASWYRMTARRDGIETIRR